MGKALEGIKVVELSTYVAVPTCGRMLADMGADVIKVESPRGDTWRIHGANNGITATEEENPLFDLFNSGKRGIVLDLKNPRGLALLYQLLEGADIFLTNTRMKSLKKLGLAPETLRGKFPRLIYGALSGFGERGPEREEPGFDSVAFWAKTGFLADMTTRTDNTLPVMHPTSVGDAATAAILLNGVLAALLQRERTGRGDYVTTSLYNTGIWLMGGMVIMAQDRYGVRYPKSREEGGAFRGQFKCADGEWVMVMILDEGKYADAYFEVLGRGDLADDPRFSTIAARRLHKPELFAIVEPIFLERTCDDWLQRLKAKDIPCTRVNHFRDVSHSEQAWVNGFVEEFQFRNGETCVMPCPPIRMASQGETPGSRPAPLLGEHTGEVLAGLGLSGKELEELTACGAAVQHP